MKKEKATIEEKQMTIRGKNVFYIESNHENLPENAPVLVLLQGWPVSCLYYENFMKQIGDTVKCYAVDFPGWGDSEADYRNFYGFDYLTEFVKEFAIQVLGNDDFSIFGYSTGGIVAINYAYKYKLNGKVITFSAPYDGISHMRKTFQGGYFFKLWMLFLRLFRIFPYSIIALQSHSLKRLFIKNYCEKVEWSSASLKTFLHEPEYAEFAQEVIKHTANGHPKPILDIAVDLGERNFTEIASKLQTPTLVLSAENDNAVNITATKKLAEIIPNAEFEYLAGGDHYSIAVETDFFVNVVKRFLVK